MYHAGFSRTLRSDDRRGDRVVVAKPDHRGEDLVAAGQIRQLGQRRPSPKDAGPRARSRSVLMPLGTVWATRSSSESAPISASILAMSAGRGPMCRSGNPERASIRLPSFPSPDCRPGAFSLASAGRSIGLRVCGEALPLRRPHRSGTSIRRINWHRCHLDVVSPARRHRQGECSATGSTVNDTAASGTREEWRGSGKGGNRSPAVPFLRRADRGFPSAGARGSRWPLSWGWGPPGEGSLSGFRHHIDGVTYLQTVAQATKARRIGWNPNQTEKRITSTSSGLMT